MAERAAAARRRQEQADALGAPAGSEPEAAGPEGGTP
jgi:hypothetical protein